jgi:hypothetical protein
MVDPRSVWSMRFTVLPLATPGRKIVEARFKDVILNDGADVDEWARRVNVELARFGEIVDLLIDLEGLRVRPGASRRFGEVRAKVLSTHSRHSARYGPDGWTATSVNTSRVLHGAEANIHATRELALQALLDLRAEDP